MDFKGLLGMLGGGIGPSLMDGLGNDTLKSFAMGPAGMLLGKQMGGDGGGMLSPGMMGGALGVGSMMGMGGKSTPVQLSDYLAMIGAPGYMMRRM